MCVSSMSQTGQWTRLLHDCFFLSLPVQRDIFTVVFPYVLLCSFWAVVLLTGPWIFVCLHDALHHKHGCVLCAPDMPYILSR